MIHLCGSGTGRINRTRIRQILRVLLVVSALALVGCGGSGKSPPTLVDASDIADSTKSEQADAQSQGQDESSEYTHLVKVTMRPQEPLEAGPGLPLPSPSEALGLLPEAKAGSTTEEALIRSGSSYEEALPHSRISRDGDYLVFNAEPGDDRSALSCEFSFAAYRFSVADYDGSQTMGFDWGLPPSG